MNQKRRRRHKVFVQKSIQKKLAGRCVFYWSCCLGTVFLFVTISMAFSGKLTTFGELFAGVWSQYSTPVVASFLLLPLVVWDMIKFSHRFVGPLIRLEGEMRRLANGESVRPLQFRKDDYWHGLADQFNALRTRHLQLEHQAKVTGDEPPNGQNHNAAKHQKLTGHPV